MTQISFVLVEYANVWFERIFLFTILEFQILSSTNQIWKPRTYNRFSGFFDTVDFMEIVDDESDEVNLSDDEKTCLCMLRELAGMHSQANFNV